MRSSRGSRTSTSSVTDASRVARSKEGLNDASRKSARSNTSPNKSNPSKKPGKEKNPEVIDIQPLVYSFRVPSNPSPGSVMNALLPPYWLYHDHAFGVIWMLFHQDKKYIGIAQLHWCLRFLLDLKNTEGEYTGDVNVCIQAVQDDLIEQYANVGTALEKQESPKQRNKDASTKNKESDEKIDENKGNNETGNKSDQEESTESNIENEGANKPPSAVQQQQSRSSEINKCSSMDENRYTTAQSLIYDEMMSRGPAPYTEQTPLEQIYKADANAAQIPTSTPDIAAMLTSDTSPPDIPLTEMGTEELMNFLNGSREEHVERVRKEIERLHDLEKFMEGLDKQGFRTYVTNDHVRRLDNLDGQGVVKEADAMMKRR